MKNWIQRHLVLTPEERWLIAGILAIALIGLAARFYRSTHGTPPPPVTSSANPK